MFIDITNVVTLLFLLLGTVLLIFLGHHLKKSFITAVPLFAFLALLILHVFQLMTLSADYNANLSWCIVLDLAFIFITFISYLWIDDIEAKATNKKSIDNSLEWFWKEV